MAGTVFFGSAMDAKADAADVVLSDDGIVSSSGSYAEYLEEHADSLAGAFSSEAGTLFLGKDFLTEIGGDVCEQDEAGILLFDKGDGCAEYSFSVESEGMYYLSVEYALTEETDRSITAGIMINGEYPFTEAEEIGIPRIFQDASEIRVDSVGNEVAPQQVPVYDWQKHTLMNTNGYYDGAYRFGERFQRHDADGICQCQESGIRSPGLRYQGRGSDDFRPGAAPIAD